MLFPSDCSPRQRLSLATASMIVAAAAIRLLAARGDLWLDEIWSLELSQSVQSTWQILTRLHDDNSHPLNTAILRFLGEGFPSLVYRAPAIVAGVLSILVGGMLGRRWGHVESRTIMMLLTISFPLVQYSSEARGYASLIFFALAATHFLIDACHAIDIRYRARWMFTACCIGGFLSHPLFLQFWIASVVWSVMLAIRRNDNGTSTQFVTFEISELPRSACPTNGKQRLNRNALWSVVRLQAVPVAGAIGMYLLQWSQIRLGGGPSYRLSAKLFQAASIALGGPLHGWWSAAAGLTCALLTAGGIFLMRRRQNETATLFVLLILIPVIQAAVMRPPFLFARYFLVSILFASIAIAWLLSDIYRRGVLGRWVYACGIILLTIAHTGHVAELVSSQRGQYSAALAFIAECTTGEEITISSDHDFGISKLVSFYGEQAAPEKHFQYIKGVQWPTEGPQWLVLHQPGDDPHTDCAERLSFEGHSFLRAGVFPSAPLSGWQLACYRRTP